MDSKSGKSWLFDSGKGPAGRVRFYGSGTNKKKITAVATGAILSSLESKMIIPVQ